MKHEEQSASREDALAFLKEKGIWDKLMNPENNLRYIHTGFIKVFHLKTNEPQRSIKIESSELDCHDTEELAFILLHRDTVDYVWFWERSPEFSALMGLMEDW